MKKIYLSFLLSPLLSFSLIGQDTQGLFLNDYQPKQANIPPFADYQPPFKNATTTIAINMADTIAKVSKYVFGNNTNIYMTQMVDQPDLIKNIKTLSPNIIRFPGGNLSSVYFWNAAKDQSPADAPAKLVNGDTGNEENSGYWYGKNMDNWTMSVDNYYKMLEQTNSTGIITINYGYARYGTSPAPVQTAAKLAADWVRDDNGRTKYWEIGNESYGSWQAGYRINTQNNKDGQSQIQTGELYGSHFNVYADSMRKAATEIGATIYIGAQLIEAEPASWATQTVKTWNSGLFKSIGNAADFFIVHSYYTPYQQNSTPEQILATPATETKSMVDYVSKTVQAAGAQMKPLALTEWNIFAEGSKQQVSYINGIHAAMTLGELIKNKYGMASRWDLVNSWGNGNDHGMFSKDEPGIPLWNPRPVFYYMYYFQKYFGDRLVSSSVSGSNDIGAYASRFNSGQAGIVVVNKGTTEETVALALSNYGYGDRYYLYSLTGGTDNGNFSLKVNVNGQTSSLPAGGPAEVETVKSQSAPIGSGVKVTSPPRSVQYILVENSNKQPQPVVLATEEEKQVVGVNVYPTPSNNHFQIALPGRDFDNVEINDLRGASILSQTISPSQRTVEFQTSFQPGMYLIRLSGNHANKVLKLMIE